MKKRFAGISFGGIFGGGTTIFSERYKLEIYKDTKTKEWKQVIKKKWFPIRIHMVLLLFPLIDILYYIAEFKPYILRNFANWFMGLFKGVSSPIDINLPSFHIPIWLINILLFTIVILAFIFIYLIAFKGVRRWHGCEHKVIAAAENDDIDNVKKYTPISNYCGGTYMLSIYLAIGFYYFISLYLLKLVLPVGIMSFILFIIIVESRFFHKYNKIGIWIGRVLQKYITISEPYDWQLKLGSNGIKKLIDIECNNKNLSKG